MITDLILAILHHLLVFTLVSLVVVEGVLIRVGLNAVSIGRLAQLDRSYGITAVAVIVVGVLRVIFGAKGWEYYVGNLWFWVKMASFVAVAVASVPATMRISAWARAAKSDPSFSPPAAEVSAALFYIRAESVGIVLILVFAATMARFG